MEEIVWMTTHESNVAFLTALYAEEHKPVKAVYSPLDSFFDMATAMIDSGVKVLIARGGAATDPAYGISHMGRMSMCKQRYECMMRALRRRYMLWQQD